jgi:hypothetical protein
MKVLMRQVYKSGEDNSEILSFDKEIKVHAYEVSARKLGEIMRAGLHLLAELAELEAHPLHDEAKDVLLEWDRFLPARLKPRVGEQDLGGSAPKKAPAPAAANPSAPSPAASAPVPPNYTLDHPGTKN